MQEKRMLKRKGLEVRTIDKSGIARGNTCKGIINEL